MKIPRHRQLEARVSAYGLDAVERPKLSDGGDEARRLQPQRDAAVRCGAWLGGIFWSVVMA
jgi:hypothetical protein